MPNINSFAKIIVINEFDEILLIRRSKTAPTRAFDWEFPGGVIEPGEDPKIAALRELEEEAGLAAEDANYLIAGSSEDYSEMGFIFWAKIAKKTPTLSFEHDDWRWVQLHDAERLLSVPSYEKSLNFYIEKVQNGHQVKVATKCILRKADDVLLLKRADTDSLGAGFWDLPGGGVEPGENLDQAMSRELLEETGLQISKFKAVFSHTQNDAKKSTIRVGQLAESTSGEIKLSHEHSEYQWMNKDQAYEFAKHDNWPGWGEFLKQFG